MQLLKQCCHIFFEDSYQWFEICNYAYFMAKTVMGETSSPWEIPSTSLSMMMYLVSVLDKLLLVKVMR